jgi:hypothetical protein
MDVGVRDLIEEGWRSAKLGELVDGNEVFDRIDAELGRLQKDDLAENKQR